jgi:hypothetical protein
VIPGPACLWRSEPQLGRKSVGLSALFELQTSKTALQRSVKNTVAVQQSSQIKNKTGNTPGQHVTFDQCCFEADNAECYFERTSNRDSCIALLDSDICIWWKWQRLLPPPSSGWIAQEHRTCHAPSIHFTFINVINNCHAVKRVEVRPTSLYSLWQPI